MKAVKESAILYISFWTSEAWVIIWHKGYKIFIAVCQPQVLKASQKVVLDEYGVDKGESFICILFHLKWMRASSEASYLPFQSAAGFIVEMKRH